jgi:plasmid stabilization system protein ParE
VPTEPLADSQTLDLIHALLARGEVDEDAAAAFRLAYPDAPPHMVEAAVYHVYRDGVGAALDWVAAAERFLRDPAAGFDYGATWHAVYHLYNWQQFQAILPIGRDGVLERLADLKLFVSEGSTDAAAQVIRQLEELFRGDVQPPAIG